MDTEKFAPDKEGKIQRYELVDTGYHAVRWNEPVIHQLSRRRPVNDVFPPVEAALKEAVDDVLADIPEQARRSEAPSLPGIAEPEVMRHYLRLSQQTFGHDSGITIGFGTCTMKYSPKVNDQLASLPTVADVHPLQPEETLQGILEIMYELRTWLCELSGMDEFTLQPRGGAHGVYTNANIMKAYHRSRGDHERTEVITSAVSHPCNAGCPASAGFKVITLYPDKETGNIGLDQLKAAVSERTAGLMLTAPYDTGVFDSELADYIDTVHDAGGLVSLDQANFNGVMTRLRAGDMGADMMHFNLHKTFSTPHGSCGPASGAVGVKKELRRFLPIPVVEFDDTGYHLNYDMPDSVGHIGGFYGVVINAIKAYAYIMAMGAKGLREAAEWAVINNNYLINGLLQVPGVDIAWPNRRKLQEARFHLQKLKEETGIGTSDFNERVGDYGISTYFESHEPMVIAEPVTPEATEAFSREDLDRFIEVFHRVSEEAHTDPDIVKTAPHRLAIHQPDPVGWHEHDRTITTWRTYLKKQQSEP
jgi:glycine dehydrogenase subunit 2